MTTTGTTTPAGPALHSTWTTIKGLRVHARVGGEASARLPIVLVHGLSVSSRYLAPTAHLLAPLRAVAAPDLPGFGESAKPRHVLDIPALATTLLAWMDAADLGRAVMLGNSLGCQIIVEVAVRWPERLAAVILVGPTIDPAGRTIPAQAWRLLRDMPFESPGSIVTQASDYLRAGPRRTLVTLRHAFADQIERKLPFVTAPALVVRGARDPIAPQRWCETVAAALPRGELLVVPRAPHALNYVRPAELAGATFRFLERHGL